MFESDGYIEESEDMKNDPNLLVEDDLSRKTRGDEKEETTKNERISNLDLLIENDKVIIKSASELEEILMGKLKFKEYNCVLSLVDKEINGKEKLSVISGKEILIILNHLFTELHPGLIELSDNFIQERRRYFKIDNETYINIVNFFLRKKEEFFLCVLSDLMARLNISQKALDNTFFFYINVADGSDSEVKVIREAYDKVYHAGIKYSIVPKNITKSKLQKVLQYQCEIYEKLINQFPSYEIDLVEIMVTDHVYLEYGLDREAIKAAIKKFSLYQDDEFIKVKSKLENFQNNSFINI